MAREESEELMWARNEVRIMFRELIGGKCITHWELVVESDVGWVRCRP